MKSIGIIHTPFKEFIGTPIQSSRSKTYGEIEMFSEYEGGLDDVDGLSHLILIYVFHSALNSKDLMVTPFLDDKPHGIFAIRFYRRPNPIGLSVVRLIQRKGLLIQIQNVDMLDGTPPLNIKPYIPEFDVHAAEKIGWYANRAHQ